MIRMSEMERFFCLVGLLCLTFAAYMINEELTRPERMARDGYLSHHEPNDLTTYWYNPFEGKSKQLKEF